MGVLDCSRTAVNIWAESFSPIGSATSNNCGVRDRSCSSAKHRSCSWRIMVPTCSRTLGAFAALKSEAMTSSWRASISCSALATAACSPLPAAFTQFMMRSVMPARAETTTTMRSRAAASCTMRAELRMRAAFPTEVPPNFMTIVFFITLRKRLTFLFTSCHSEHHLYGAKNLAFSCESDTAFAFAISAQNQKAHFQLLLTVGFLESLLFIPLCHPRPEAHRCACTCGCCCHPLRGNRLLARGKHEGDTLLGKQSGVNTVRPCHYEGLSFRCFSRSWAW